MKMKKFINDPANLTAELLEGFVLAYADKVKLELGKLVVRARPKHADKVALDAIKAGTMVATVQQLPYEMGKKTAVLADALIKGQKLTFDDVEKKEIYVPVKLITKANVDEALAALK